MSTEVDNAKKSLERIQNTEAQDLARAKDMGINYFSLVVEPASRQ